MRNCIILQKDEFIIKPMETAFLDKMVGLLWNCIYLIFNGIERFFIEKIRINTEYDIFGGITQAEIISFCLVILGLIGCILLHSNNKNTNQIKTQKTK